MEDVADRDFKTIVISMLKELKVAMLKRSKGMCDGNVSININYQ